ncbi:MAG: helix-turn-helix domain-containing protein, partial [Chitinophagaceae bacterium]
MLTFAKSNAAPGYSNSQRNVTHMDIELKIKMNEKLFLRDPEQSELGQKIIRQSIALIYEKGFESFTFKKLAEDITTTEAGVYRYFENKHRLLI